MSKQIFKHRIPNEILFEFLEQGCMKTDKYYLIDMNAYKRIIFHKFHLEFFAIIIDFYQDSKRFYVEREFTYNSFTNIIRQICKYNQIKFTSQIKYTDANYNIDYYVYFPSDEHLFDDLSDDDNV